MKSLSYCERAKRYAEALVDGKIPASRLTVLACKRHLDDLKRQESPEFPYWFSEREGNRICAFVEAFPHVKGAWARRRETIALEDWQCFVLAVSHGWLHTDTDTRRFRFVYIEVPRKNAKTTLSAPVALDKMSADGEQGAEIVAAATKKDQARIVFDIARSMVKKSAEFRTEFGVEALAHRIVCQETESTFNAIDSKGSTQDGANLHFSLNDELHAWKGRELYAVLETAMGSREEPMMWNITTAGDDQSGICYEQREYLERVLTGIFVDESYFGIVYTVDSEDDIFDEATWRKANPNYGVSVLPRDMKALANKAQHNPKSRGDFKMKRLNVWINAAEAYFDIDAWKACADPMLSLDDLRGASCRMGLDLASKRDINAKVQLFELSDSRLAFVPTFWLPEKAIEEGACSSYRGWVDEGWINVTPGNVVDFDAIEASIIGEMPESGGTLPDALRSFHGPTGGRDRVGDCDATLFDLVELGFDPHQAYQMVQHLMASNVPCVEVRPTVLNFSEPMKQLDALTEEHPQTGKRGLVHNGNPVMDWMIANVTAEMDRKDNVYPRKTRPENKIDGVVAAIMALALHLKAKVSGPRVFPVSVERIVERMHVTH